MSDRLKAAQDYVARKPTDRFGLYALAMELRKGKQWEDCYRAFETLLQHHPDYGAGWYHFAMSRKEGGDRAGCIELLRKGMEVTQRTKDTKTHAELESALDELLDE